MLLNLISNSIMDFLFALLAYMHRALQKELLTDTFVDYCNTSTLARL